MKNLVSAFLVAVMILTAVPFNVLGKETFGVINAQARTIYKVDDSFIFNNRKKLKNAIIKNGNLLSNGNTEFYRKFTDNLSIDSVSVLYNVEQDGIAFAVNREVENGEAKGTFAYAIGIIPVNENKPISILICNFVTDAQMTGYLSCSENITVVPNEFNYDNNYDFTLENLKTSLTINQEIIEVAQNLMNDFLDVSISTLDYLISNYFDISVANIGFTGTCESHNFVKSGTKNICSNCGSYYEDSVKENYKVTYNANGGSVSPTSANVESGKSVTLPTPTKSGYTCLGWATSSTATSASYKCGTAYVPTSNTTLYAIWKSNVILGDVSGDTKINSSDALLVLQHSVGSISLTGDKKTAADTDKNGQINSSDALRILQYSVGQIAAL